MTENDEQPYKPKYSGFDTGVQERAQKTMERAKESEGAKGEDANKEYIDDGPAEYDRRMAQAEEDAK